MSPEQLILKIIQQELNYEVNEYSGRGMYGKKCLGVVTDNTYNTLVNIVANVCENHYSLEDKSPFDNVEDIIQILSIVKVDSFGRDFILYWPQISIKNDKCCYYCINNEDGFCHEKKEVTIADINTCLLTRDCKTCNQKEAAKDCEYHSLS